MPQTREHYNERMRLYMKRRFGERKALALKLLGEKCAKCGSVEKLQFDHIERSTRFRGVTEMYGHSESRFMEELKKCQLLCAGCHNRKTLSDLGRVSVAGTHGTLSAYRFCHCELCRKAKNEYVKVYRITHPRSKKKAETTDRA